MFITFIEKLVANWNIKNIFAEINHGHTRSNELS